MLKMPAATRITLSPEEERTLHELSLANSVPRRTKVRALALRLNASGWSAPKLAKHLKQSPHTTRETIRRWQTRGLGGLWEAPGRGIKPRWSDADMAAVAQWLEQERSYTSPQLCAKLATERGVHLGSRRLQRILKKKAGSGSESATAHPSRNRSSTRKQNELIG